MEFDGLRLAMFALKLGVRVIFGRSVFVPISCSGNVVSLLNGIISIKLADFLTLWE